MTKHTEGPWYVHPGMRTAVFGPSDVRNGGKIAATKEGHAFPEIPEEEAEANAQVIAASLDMLSALAEVVRLHDKPLPIDQHRDPEKLWVIMQCMADAARAAIAKAEGRATPHPGPSVIEAAAPTAELEREEKRAELAATSQGWRLGDSIIYDSNVFESWKAALSYAGDDGRDERERESRIYSTWRECCEGEDIDVPADLHAAMLDRIRDRLDGKWYDPFGDLESDIRSVLDLA